MTRCTHEQFGKVGIATQVGAVRELYKDLEDDLITPGCLDAGHLLTTQAGHHTTRDTTTDPEMHRNEVCNDLRTNHHECHSGPQGAKDMTFGERLQEMDEVIAQESEADHPAAAILTLEERVSRLEAALTKALCISSGPGNVSDGHLQLQQNKLRFNTHFKTPQLCLAAFHVDERSCIRTMSLFQGGEERSSESACWLPLLENLHRKEQELHRHGSYDAHPIPDDQDAGGQLVGPALRYLEMSWGSIPPEIARPFAIATVSDIAIIARRLGMSWEVFSPEGDSMRAQCDGQGIFSTQARPTGRVLGYTRLTGGLTSTDKSIFQSVGRLSKSELYITMREADVMGFGILPGCHSLSVPSFQLGTTEDVYTTIDILDSTRKASSKLRDINHLLAGKWDAHCMYEFSDIIALAAPMIRRRNSTIIRVPMPAECCSSLLSQKECFVVFHNRLKQYLGTRSEGVPFEHADWILKQYERPKTNFSEWENETENINRVNGRDLSFLEEVHGCWDSTTAYFVRLQQTHRLRYLDLMASHISHAVNYWCEAWQRIKDGTARDNYGLRALEAEGSHLYFDYLPLIVKDVRKRGFEGPEETVQQAWLMLMFRGFCWWRCHSLHPGEDPSYKASPLPSRYLDCVLPVYIV